MGDVRTRVATALALAALGGAGCRPPTPVAAPVEFCVPRGTWVAPDGRAVRRPAAIVDAARRRRIVLLGERHDWAEDHRWQAHVLGMLGAADRPLVVGFEALTPAADPALRRWVAGERSTDEMLADVDWEKTWGLPADLYLPIFHTGRLLGASLHGVNIDRKVVRRIATDGVAALDDETRAALPAIRAASPAYRARLADVFAEHSCRHPGEDDAEFTRFVDAQRTWDAVMAAALARLADRAPTAIVVGIVGRGHVEHRDGVVADLIVHGFDPLVLLPWPVDESCVDLAPTLADAVFGIRTLASETPDPIPSPCDDQTPAQRPR